MNVASIKQAVESYAIDELRKAEDDLLNERPLEIEIGGEDEGEKLTHILAAIFCRHEMQHSGLNLNQAIRLYSQRVRSSIN